MDNLENEFVDKSYSLIEESIEELKKHDDEYKNLIDGKSKDITKLSEIFSKLSESDKKFIDEYEDSIFAMRAIEQEWLYLQGYRDCMKFLKLVRAI